MRNKIIVSGGVSLNAIRPSYFVARYLSWHGYTIILVNPAYEGELLFGQRVYARIDQIEQPFDMVQVFRKSDAVPEIYEHALVCWPMLKTFGCKLAWNMKQPLAKRGPAALTWFRIFAPKWSTKV